MSIKKDPNEFKAMYKNSNQKSTIKKSHRSFRGPQTNQNTLIPSTCRKIFQSTPFIKHLSPIAPLPISPRKTINTLNTNIWKDRSAPVSMCQVSLFLRNLLRKSPLRFLHAQIFCTRNSKGFLKFWMSQKVGNSRKTTARFKKFMNN